MKLVTRLIYLDIILYQCDGVFFDLNNEMQTLAYTDFQNLIENYLGDLRHIANRQFSVKEMNQTKYQRSDA